MAHAIRIELAPLDGAEGRQDQVLEDLVVLLAGPWGEVALSQAPARVTRDRTEIDVLVEVLLGYTSLLPHDLPLGLGQPILGIDSRNEGVRSFIAPLVGSHIARTEIPGAFLDAAERPPLVSHRTPPETANSELPAHLAD